MSHVQLSFYLANSRGCLQNHADPSVWFIKPFMSMIGQICSDEIWHLTLDLFHAFSQVIMASPGCIALNKQ